MVGEQKFGTMVALAHPDIKAVPLEKIIGRVKTVPIDSDKISTARDIGICLGD
jgi:6-phosphofructokinase 1